MAGEDARTFPEADRRLYAQLMGELRGRCLEAQRLLAYDDVDGYVELNLWHANYAALQLRLCIESVVMASMVANRRDLAAVAAKFERYQPRAAHKAVRQLNSNHWPVPFEVVSVDHGREGVPPTGRGRLLEDGFMSENQWLDDWRIVSDLLHAQNPYRIAPHPLRRDLPEVYASLARIRRELWSLVLTHHVVLNDPGTKLVRQLYSEDGHVHVSTTESRPLEA